MADLLGQQGAERLQHAVAGLVAEGVVQRLEVVDVEHHQRERKHLPRAAGQLAVQRLRQVAPVEEPRQRVAQRLLAQAGLQRLDLRQLSGQPRVGAAQLLLGVAAVEQLALAALEQARVLDRDRRLGRERERAPARARPA